MKNFVCTIPVFLYFSLQSMDCIKDKESVPKYSNKTVANDIFQDYMRKYPNYGESFQDNVIALSKEIKTHKKPQLCLLDISKVLESYSYMRDLHKGRISDEENIFFLETMLPMLFENYNFSSLFNDPSFAKHQLRFLPMGGINPYMGSCYLYNFNFPIKRLEKKSPLLLIAIRAEESLFLQTEDGTLITDFDVLVTRTLQDMVTPPNSWIQTQKKELLIPVKALLLSLKRHSKENNTYRIPKPIKALILFHTILNSKAAQQYKKIRDDLLDELECCRKDHENFDHTNCICTITLYSSNFKMCDPVPLLLQQFSHDLNINF